MRRVSTIGVDPMSSFPLRTGVSYPDMVLLAGASLVVAATGVRGRQWRDRLLTSGSSCCREAMPRGR